MTTKGMACLDVIAYKRNVYETTIGNKNKT
jgi:hypothetical protein